LVSNYQNLLIDIDPDHCTDHPKSSPQRLVSKLGTMKPINEFDLPISVQRRKQAKMEGIGMVANNPKIKSSRQFQSITPSRERTQFDFNPKDLNELCQAIEHAKIQKGNGYTQAKSPATKSTATVLIQPLI
jgi:23S rRNA A2030 N6-methylase RlmJ